MKFLIKPLLKLHSTLWSWNTDDCRGVFHSSFRVTNKLLRWIYNNPGGMLAYGTGWWLGHETFKSKGDTSSGIAEFIKIVAALVGLTIVFDFLMQIIALVYVFVVGLLPGAFVIRFLRLLGLWENHYGEEGYGHCTIRYIDNIWREVRADRIDRILNFNLGY